MSVKINKRLLDKCVNSIQVLEKTISEYAAVTNWHKQLIWFINLFIWEWSMREHDSKKLNREYERLVEGLRDASNARDTDVALVNPVLPSEILEGENFLEFSFANV